MLGAELQPGETEVLLTTTRLAEGAAYTLMVGGVRDASAQRNAIAPGSSVKFHSLQTGPGWLRREVYLGAGGANGSLLADFLAQCPQHHLDLPAFYQRKRDSFLKLIGGSRFKFTPSAGTYFQMLDYSAISAERDVDLARRWTVEKKLAAIPISVFYATAPETTWLRFCFAKDDATLSRAAEILCSL